MRKDETQLAAMPRISVVIPTYNYAQYLPQAIESVLAQTVAPLEIFVADDGSTDDTAAVAARYENRIRHLRFPHRGVYALRTGMLEELRGEWWLNLDADNWLAPDFLERMSAAIAANQADETFAFAYPDMELFGDSSGRVERPEFDLQRLKIGNYIDMNSVIRTATARRFGFDPAFNSGQGDYDFFLTLVENGYRGKRVPEALLHYRVHDGSISQAVGRKRNQRKIMNRIVLKHCEFFSPAEARAALSAADNRMLVTLIESRSPFADFGRRLADWLRFARAGWRHAEFQRQTAYCFSPASYFERTAEAANVFYLFRDTPDRRDMVRRAMAGVELGRDRAQLFGFDDLDKQGMAMGCNLRFPRAKTTREIIGPWIESHFSPTDGLGWGDWHSVQMHLDEMNRSRVVVATSDNTGLPAMRLKSRGRLKPPLIYVSIGLPERLMALESKNPARVACCRKRLSRVDLFVTYGYAEAEWLKRWLGDKAKVRFVPFGVDAKQWSPVESPGGGMDVLSIGADSMRDFGLLVEYACRHPAVEVCLVTGRDCAARLSELPANMRLKIRVPIEELQELIAGAKVVVLPVKENTYSGATTTLLQCMAMGKAVAVSRVGAIRNGYDFVDGEHLRWMEPGSQKSLETVVDDLLASGVRRKQLGRAARMHVESHLKWNQYVDQMRAAMQTVAGCKTFSFSGMYSQDV